MRFKTNTELAFVAGVLEGRGHIEFMKVSLRMKGNLPMALQQEFGGCFFWHREGKARRGWWRIQGGAAYQLLLKIYPYFLGRYSEVRGLLERWEEREAAA